MLAESTTGLFLASATIWSNCSSDSSCRTSSVLWFVSPLFRNRSWKKLLRLLMSPARPCFHLLILLVSTLVFLHPNCPTIAVVFIGSPTCDLCLAPGWLWCCPSLRLSHPMNVSLFQLFSPLFTTVGYLCIRPRVRCTTTDPSMGVSSPFSSFQQRPRTTNGGSGPSQPSSNTLAHHDASNHQARIRTRATMKALDRVTSAAQAAGRYMAGQPGKGEKDG